MINAAHRGEIKLTDYWNVGDSRTVSLNEGITADGTKIPEQDVNLVLAHKITDISSYQYNGGEFVVTQQDCLSVKIAMDTLGANSRLNIHQIFFSTELYNFLEIIDSGYLNQMLPSWLHNSLVTVTPIIYSPVGGSENTLESKIFLASEREVFGQNKFVLTEETSGFEQWEWYSSDTSNRIKLLNHYKTPWWLRSMGDSDVSFPMCCVSSDGNMSCENAATSLGVAPCMVI